MFEESLISTYENSLLFAAIKENRMLFLNYTVKKELWKSEKEWQRVGYEQDFIDDKTCRKRVEEYWERSGLATKIRIFCRT